jgi:FkbM family methyltransferase
LVNKFRNVKLFRLALGDRDGRALLGIPRWGASGENTMAIDASEAKLMEAVEVRRFDRVAEKNGISKVDVVKNRRGRR